MSARTFVVGDIHGDYRALRSLLDQFPPLCPDDTLVFLGDYVDRGPESAQVVQFLSEELPKQVSCRVVMLRGNHEDGWLRVHSGGWPEFILPAQNGCVTTYRSYHGGARPSDGLSLFGQAPTTSEEFSSMQDASFFPQEHLALFEAMPFYHEDEHAIYVHAGLPEGDDGQFLHPSEVDEPALLLWTRTLRFFTQYRGKTVVVGHTSTDCLPSELSEYQPHNPLALWKRGPVLAIDTGCGKGGFLTAVELPSMTVYESREPEELDGPWNASELDCMPPPADAPAPGDAGPPPADAPPQNRPEPGHDEPATAHGEEVALESAAAFG